MDTIQEKMGELQDRRQNLSESDGLSPNDLKEIENEFEELQSQWNDVNDDFKNEDERYGWLVAFLNLSFYFFLGIFLS